MRGLVMARSCIFCEGGPLTKEHMWADWLRAYIPRNRSEFHTGSTILFKDPAKTQIKTRTIPDDPHKMQIRCVCESCNNGWMSVLQNRIKPILVPLLNGKPFTLTSRQQAQLAAWATMFTMVAEFSLRQKEMAAVTQEERAEFRRTKTPLKNWKFWIASIDHPDWIGRYIHTSMQIGSKDQVSKVTSSGIPVPNTQTTTFVVNKLYIHTLSSTAGIDLRKQKIDPAIAQRIWPARSKSVKWPPASFLSPFDADWLSMAYFRNAVSRTR
jgi:hypothetical protein